MVILETKLRIRRAADMSALAAPRPGHEHEETSFLVSSFSFTGTKLYALAMEGAILTPPEGYDDPAALPSAPAALGAAAAKGAGAGASARRGGAGGGADEAQTVHALVAKAQQRSKKRTFDQVAAANASAASAAAASVVSSSGAALSSAHSSASALAQQAQQAGEAAAPDSVDKYNIFLHPPRKFSTLAGTRYGGSACHYIQSRPQTHLGGAGKAASSSSSTSSSSSSNGGGLVLGVGKVSDFVILNEDTKIRAGEYMHTEGLINFLGTLTMTLNAAKKITRFEFLYSHMD